MFASQWWADTDIAGIEVINRVAPLGNGAWEETYNMAPITGVPMLVAFNAADYAWGLDKLSDAAVLAQYMAVLRSQFGSSVPDPVSVSGAPRRVTVCVCGWRHVLRCASRQLLLAGRPARPPACSPCAHSHTLLLSALQYNVTSWGRDPFSYGSYSFTKRPVNGFDGYPVVHTK